MSNPTTNPTGRLSPRGRTLPKNWPFKDADTAAEYHRLCMSGYALLRQAHELFQRAIKELK